MFEIDASWRGDQLVLTITGELDLATAPAFRRAALDALAQASADGPRRIVVDLTACDHLDSVGVGLLLGLHRRARLASGSLVVVAPAPHVRRVIELTELDRIVSVVDETPAPTSPADRR